LGVPEDKLLSTLYKAEANRKAKNEVKDALKEEAAADGQEAVA